MSERLNLIFIQNGYGRYCVDMEVNDISLIKYSYRKYKEVPRQGLVEKLTQEDKDIILKAFVRDMPRLVKQIEESSLAGDKILVLTDPLCTLDTRERIFRDIIADYEKFMGDQSDLEARAAIMEGKDSAAAKDMWDKFVGDD